jgi:hypothetical protein
LSSVLSKVRSSLRRAHEVCIGCTQTNRIDRSAASCPRTRQRCPVGSHDTVTPAKPFAVARSAAQSNAIPRSHARHRNVRRASTFESWSVTTTICLRSARSIPTIAFSSGTSSRSRASRAFRLRSPRETPLRLVMNVLLSAMGHQARQAHQGDVPTSGTTRRTSFYAAIGRSRRCVISPRSRHSYTAASRSWSEIEALLTRS